MDKKFEQTQSSSLQRGINYDWNDEMGQRQLNYDESSRTPNLAALFSKELSEGAQLQQQVDEQVAQSLTLLESKEKSYLYETEGFYILWEWDSTDKKRIFALSKSPSLGTVSLSNSQSQQWKDYLPSEASKLKLILSAAKEAPKRAQLSNELRSELEKLLPINLSQVVLIRNSAKAAQLKARAVTIGQEIHFAPNEWNEENESFVTLLVHELAHIYQNNQQRVGATNMLGNQPINDDPRMEKEADDAARAVSKGQSFSFGKFKSGDNDLMKNFAQRKVAQRKAIKTNWGEFVAKPYLEPVEANNSPSLKINISFNPNDEVESPKIGFVQTVKVTEGNEKIAPNISAADRMAEDGTRIDRTTGNNNPVYGTENLNANELDIAKSTANNQNSIKFGKKSSTEHQNAELEDTPSVIKNEGRVTHFETTAVSLDGKQKNTYYGSVTWGWKIANQEVKVAPFDIGSKEAISDKFTPAIKKWNESKISPQGQQVRLKPKENTVAYKIDAAGNLGSSPITITLEEGYADPFEFNNCLQVMENISYPIGGLTTVCTIIKAGNQQYAVLPSKWQICQPDPTEKQPQKSAQLEEKNTIQSVAEQERLAIGKQGLTIIELVDLAHSESPQEATITLAKGSLVKIDRDPETKAFLITPIGDDAANIKNKTYILELRGKNLSEIVDLNSNA